MKVTRNTPEHLIVGENPIWVALLTGGVTLFFTIAGVSALLAGEITGLVAFLGTALGLLTMLAFVRRVQLIFDGAAGTLTVQRKNLRQSGQVIHPLSEVEHAVVERSNDLSRVTLLLTGESAGRHPITKSYSNVGDHAGVADAINAWLDSHRSAT